MLGENKNPKDSIKDTSSVPAPYEAEGFRSTSLSIPYTKTNKLITALYMVTDIMDKDEPLRTKLRVLGVNIISDIHSSAGSNLGGQIDEVLSLLDITSALRMISEMNCSILKKEFLELKRSIGKPKGRDNPAWLEEFLGTDGPVSGQLSFNKEVKKSIEHYEQIGSANKRGGIKVGVQKGSTLLKALNKIKISDGAVSASGNGNNFTKSNSFDLLKKQRRELILKIIKDIPLASIKDIILTLHKSGEEWGEKTLQRELVSMVHDGVLEKTGEKRWSRYSIKK